MSKKLSDLIDMTEAKIMEWYRHFEGKVYVSFSGGKDSTVLLHLVRSLFPDVEAVFINTGIEYPEVINFVRTVDNVTFLKPKYTFFDVVDKYGYPVVSKEVSQKIHEIRNTNSNVLLRKRLLGDKNGNGKISEKWKYLIYSDIKISNKCCNILKKQPIKAFEKKSGKYPYIGMMMADSALRAQQITTCNSFESKRPVSNPLRHWDDFMIWEYIKKNNIPYSKIYDMGHTRTGCSLCLFGVQFDTEKPDRLQQMHPSLYRAACEKVNYQHVADLIIGKRQKKLPFE